MPTASNDMAKKLLFYGGAFDPPHKGHEKLLESAIRELEPDLTLVIPTGVSPHKKGYGTPFWTRMEMAGCFRKLDPSVKVSSIEYTGRKGKHKCYTFETVRRLKKKYPDHELYMLIGSDMLTSFHTWHLYRRIMANCTILAGCRDEDARKGFEEAAGRLRREGGTFRLLSFTPVEVSSTELLGRLQEGGDVSDLLSPEVIGVIEREGLYRR